MKTKLFFAAIVVALFGCKTNNLPEQKLIVDILQATLVDTEVTAPVFIPNSVDTSLYLDLSKWDLTKDRYNDAYVDTFSVGGNLFRFVHAVSTNHSGLNWVPLQKRINGEWRYTTLVLEDNFQGHDFAHDKDINGDGFVDITNEIRFAQDVYFYEPQKNFYSDKALHSFIPEWHLLDKSKNIYCDFHDFKQMCGDIGSTLYTFKNFKKIDLYDLELYNCNDSGDNNRITKLILRKYVGGYQDSLLKIEEVVLEKPIDTDNITHDGKYANGQYTYFDYKKYWGDSYKKLLSKR